MESFSLLKYWRGGGGGGGGSAIAATVRASAVATNPANTTTIAASILRPSSDADDQDTATDDEDDDGSFFDLELTAVADNGDGDGAKEDGSAAESEDEGEEREFNFAVNSETNPAGDGSLSDDLFFKGKLVSLEPSSFVIAAAEAAEAAAAVAGDGNDPKPQLPVSFLKSANKFRVFTLGFRRKPNAAATEPNGAATETTTATAAPAPAPGSVKQQQQQNKFFIKFKVEEVPIVSLFTRDSSARNSSGANNKTTKLPPESAAAAPSPAIGAEEKKFPKEVVHKYLSKIKPLYVRVSKRYGDRVRLAGTLPPSGALASVSTEKVEETDAETSETAAPPPPQPASSGMSIPGLKVVRKRLGKSRSASAAVAAAPPAAPPQRRRDDSLLQQQDGIQSAIAHCKRSFTAVDHEGSESPPLVRSMSDPGEGKSEMNCV